MALLCRRLTAQQDRLVEIAARQSNFDASFSQLSKVSLLVLFPIESLTSVCGEKRIRRSQEKLALIWKLAQSRQQVDEVSSFGEPGQLRVGMAPYVD